jgi:hypothetical protein
MPAIMTHDFFGQDAYGPALGAVDLYTPSERDAVLLGNQGPDPLFYLTIVPPLHEFEKLGQTMHHDAPSALFLSLRRAVDGLPEDTRSVGRAFLAGFVCHYVLDRTMHPFVYFWERGICAAGVDGLDASDHSIVHAEIERDLDEMVLFSKRGQTIEEYRPFEQVLEASDSTLDVLGEVFGASKLGPFDVDGEEEPTLSRVYPLAVRSFRVVQRFFWSPGGRKMGALARVEGHVTRHRYSLVRAMSHRVRAEETSDFDNRDRRAWKNPFTHVTRNESFWDLYDSALAQVEGSIAMVFADDFDDDAAKRFTRGLNFSGELVERV